MGKAYMEGSFESICKVNCFGIMLEVALNDTLNDCRAIFASGTSALQPDEGCFTTVLLRKRHKVWP